MEETYHVTSSKIRNSNAEIVAQSSVQSGNAESIGQSPAQAATTTKPASNRLAIVVSLLALYIIWGSTYLAMRIALAGFGPFWMAGIRFLVAGLILYPIMRVRGAANPTKKEWLGAAIVGILLLVGGNAGVAFAEQWVASGLAAVGLAVIPLWTALFVGLMGRWPTRLEWWGLGLGFTGVILLNLGNSVWANPIGAIALLLAPISWALGSALSTRVKLPQGAMSSASQMLVGGFVLIALSLAVREPLPNFHIVSSVWAVVFLIVFGSLVAFSAYGYLLRTVRPALATSYAYINPMVAVALGIAVDGEHITLLGLLAMLVILSGVALVSLGRGHHTH